MKDGWSAQSQDTLLPSEGSSKHPAELSMRLLLDFRKVNVLCTMEIEYPAIPQAEPSRAGKGAEPRRCWHQTQRHPTSGANWFWAYWLAKSLTFKKPR